MTILFVTGCSHLDFITSGSTPFKISVGHNSENAVEIKSNANFYFWGNLPKKIAVDLEKYGNEFGLEQPSYVKVEQFIGWKSFLITIVTLGVYCPVDYRISLLALKGPQI